MQAIRPEHLATPRVCAEDTSLLSVNHLSISFPGADGGKNEVVSDLSYSIGEGETIGIVGESGSGKSMTSLSLMGLLPSSARAVGSIKFEGKELMDLTPQQWRQHRGQEIAMIFQEPMTAMNPVMKVGQQIAEALLMHEKLSKKQAYQRAVELLASVHIPSPERRAQDYPHQLSGGMLQRAMIAMALALRPKLLVADEPTTALDVTVQAQILDLMLELQQEHKTSIQFISHNLAVVSEIANHIIVMYSGRIVEYAAAEDLFSDPLHPYTQGLIQTLPSLSRPVDELFTIPGSVGSRTPGCCFSNRCFSANQECRQAEPELREVKPGHYAACFNVAS